jgi:hypothetical protein
MTLQVLGIVPLLTEVGISADRVHQPAGSQGSGGDEDIAKRYRAHP